MPYFIPECLFNFFHANTFLLKINISITQLFKSLAKKNLLFELIIMFSDGGSLWRRVASMFDIQRIVYARNFAVDNVTVGCGVAF